MKSVYGNTHLNFLCIAELVRKALDFNTFGFVILVSTCTFSNLHTIEKFITTIIHIMQSSARDENYFFDKFCPFTGSILYKSYAYF